jgi:hypothetical protein
MTEPDPTEKWPREPEKPSWLQAKSDVVFKPLPRAQPSETPWTVIHASVNKLNTRIATMSRDEDCEVVAMKLWTTTGDLIWKREEPMHENGVFVKPVFTEDGQYFGAYYQDKVEIIEARSTKLVRLVSVREREVDGKRKPFKATSISISQQGRRLAITTDLPAPKTADSAAWLEEKPYRFPQVGSDIAKVDAIVTTKLDKVEIVYIEGGNVIFGVGTPAAHWDRRYEGLNLYSVLAFSWDVATRRLIKWFSIAPQRFDRVGCLSYATLASESAVVIHVSNTQDLAFGTPATMFAFSGKGHKIGEFGGGSLVQGSVPDCVVILQADESLRIWDGDKNVEKIGVIKKESSLLSRVKAMAVEEAHITLALTDESIVRFQL